MSKKSTLTQEAKLKSATILIPNEGVKCGVRGCKYLQELFKPSNFVRHFKSQHPRDYNLLNLGDPVPEGEPPTKKGRSEPLVSVAISKATFIGALVKLVTIHCLPFASMMWEGFREIINPLSAALNVVINSHNIRDFVNTTASNIKEIIRTEVAGKIVCLKIDAASKLYRSVLGVNCQYVLDGKLVKRTLGVVELHERHSGENLCKEVFKLAEEYGIQKWQIFSVTVDNGANMIKMIKMMNESVIREFPAAEEREEEREGENEMDGSEEDIEGDPEQLEEIDSATDALMEALEKVVIENGTLCVRCGAHTLQLVVNDVCKSFDGYLKDITRITKKLRCAEFKRIFEITKGVKLPHIPVKTRWNTNYIMMREFVRQKEFFVNLGIQYKELDLTDYWPFIEEFTEAFGPIYECTILIQKQDCSLSDFYYHWQKTMYLISILGDENPFKSKLMSSFAKRDKILLESHALRSSLFLDPRFCYAGSKIFTTAEKEQIVEFLSTLSVRVNRSMDWNDRQTENDERMTNVQSTPSSSTSKKFSMRDFLNEKYGHSSTTPSTTNSTEVKIREIQYQQQQDPDDETFDVRQYWLKAKYENRSLWKIAETILSVPATQCSVERDFSFFNLILTKNRSQLSSKNLENVMHVRTNSELINPALQMAFKEI